MTENREGFKFNLDAPDPSDEAPQGNTGHRSIRRILALLLIGFIVVGATTVWMYYDFHHKLDAINTTGSAQLANISGQLKGRISEVSGQLARQREIVQKQFKDLEKELSRLDKAVAAVDAAKPDKKEVEESLGRVENLSKELSSQLAELKNQNRALSEKTAALSNQVQKAHADIEKNAKLLKNVAENYTKREVLETALAKERDFYSKNMAHSTEALFNEIADLHKGLQQLSKRVDAFKKAKTPGSRTAPGQTPPLPNPKPGKIMEQEISQ